MYPPLSSFLSLSLSLSLSSYLIPIFTHHGRDITELSRCCPGFCLPMCNKCRPREEQLLSEGESDEDEQESLEYPSDEESDDEGQVISFRDKEPELSEEMGDTDEVSENLQQVHVLPGLVEIQTLWGPSWWISKSPCIISNLVANKVGSLISKPDVINIWL